MSANAKDQSIRCRGGQGSLAGDKAELRGGRQTCGGVPQTTLPFGQDLRERHRRILYQHAHSTGTAWSSTNVPMDIAAEPFASEVNRVLKQEGAFALLHTFSFLSNSQISPVA